MDLSSKASKPFFFKQFVIHQDKCAMKVGTDSLLLGAWAEGNDGRSFPERILDIGTGTGVLAMMMAQRYPLAKIDAVEVDENSYFQALENVNNSKFRHHIRLYHVAFQDFRSDSQISLQYDLIISNPPYFVNAYKSGVPARDIARHNDSLTFKELIENVLRLLKPQGTLHLILPVQEGTFFMKLAEASGLYCYKKCEVVMRRSKPPKHWLLAFSRVKQAISESTLVIQDAHEVYTPEYQLMAKDFLKIF
ncbi:MAG: methyltransferase [Flammeovirgaceae bacterium]